MRSLLFVCGFLFLYGISFFSVFADTVAPPCTYKISSENGKFVFVMLAPDERVDCGTSDANEKIEAKKIRTQFPMSGLYNNESITPLWTVDWYSHKVYLSSSGQNLVRTGPWASKGTDEAFSFFKEGK